MNIWLVVVLAMLPAFGVAVFAGLRGFTPARLVGLQLATALAGIILVAMTFAFDQPAFIDLPLALALLSLPGTVILALFLERWL